MATVWPFVGAAVLGVATVPPLYQAAVDADRREFYGVLAGITGIAAVAYVVIGLGFGEVTTQGRTWEFVRYLDWLVTTPLIVLYLAMLAQPERQTYYRLVAADVVMLAGGVAANVVPGTIRYAGFVVGALAFTYLVYVLYVRLGVETSVESMERRALFEKLRNLTVVLWAMYPVVWLLSAKGFGLMIGGTETVVVVYLDVLTKAAFVLIAVNGSEAIDTAATSVEETFAD